MRRFGGWLAVFLCVVGLMPGFPAAWGAEVSVGLRLAPAAIALNETATLVVALSGARAAESEPLIAGLEDFDVVRGGTSSRMEVVNFKVSRSLQISYALTPRRSGRFTIGPAEIRVDGQTVRSATVTLEVAADAGPKPDDTLFLEVELAPDTVYPEQEAFYTLRLHRLERIADLSLALPELDGITFQSLAKPVEYTRTRGGRTFQVLELRYAVSAAGEGRYELPPARMQMTAYDQAPRRPRGFFDDPFFARGRPRTVAGQAFSLTVRPFPLAGRPSDFTGLVGRFKLAATLTPDTVKVGESATLTWVISGRGNVARLPDLKLPEPPGVKVYADQPVLTVETSGEGTEGSKTLKWALVPEEPGEYTIPDPGLSYFDPKAETYVRLAGEPRSLRVLPGSGGAPASAAGPALRSTPAMAEPTASAGTGILPLHAELNQLRPVSGLVCGGAAGVGLLLLPIGLYGLLWGVMGWRRFRVRTAAAARAKGAARRLKDCCRSGDGRPDELLQACRAYINARLGLHLGSLTADEAGALLAGRGVDPAVAARFQTVVRTLEERIYARQGQTARELGDVLIDAVKAVERDLR